MIKSGYTKLFSLLLLCNLLVFTSCDHDDDTSTPLSIVETAQADPQFSTLVDALVKADLVSTLNESTFTVFAPTNDAFDNLFNALGVSGLDDLDAATLTPILLYHVVGGTVLSSDLANGYVGTASNGPNLQALKLQVNIDNGVVLDNSVNVIVADVIATNGVIHAIDKVLLPNNIVNLALQNSNFSILVEALTRPDLTTDYVGILSGDGPFTVFAPTNDAFVKLLNELGVSSLADIDAATLEAVLQYHVIAGANLESGALSDGLEGTTVLGETVTVNTTNGVTVTDNNNRVSTVILANVQGTNGVVHAIDTVLLP